jgi:hypothetical protein
MTRMWTVAIAIYTKHEREYERWAAHTHGFNTQPRGEGGGGGWGGGVVMLQQFNKLVNYF